MSETGAVAPRLGGPERGDGPAASAVPPPAPATAEVPETAPGAARGVSVVGRETALGTVARRVAAGEGRPAELFDAFLVARVFCARPEHPGFLALDAPVAGPPPGPGAEDRGLGGGSLVAVFSSLGEFGAFTGGGEWFSLRGADLLNLLPPGHTLLLDPAGATPLWLDPAASRVEPSRSLVFDRA